ncbi:MAG: YceI family protein [Acidimicrobiia bacterium]
MRDSAAQAGRPSPGMWDLEPTHTTIAFVGRHLGGLSRVRGVFKSYTANIHIAEKLEESTAQVSIQAASLDSGVEMRDDHLKSPDFLDVEQFPEIRFASDRAEPSGNDRWLLHGVLTIRDVSRPVTLDVEYMGEIEDAFFKTKRSGFVATGEINREDFGMDWNMPMGLDGLLVGKTAKIEIESEALLQPYEDPMAASGDES